MNNEQLKLGNQLCFPVYAASRLITKEYQPFLNELKITYPQYLVLLILWEEDSQLVNDIARRLYLATNTITPLLKRMEQQGLVSRRRSDSDERQVRVQLTPKGIDLQERAAGIPEALVSKLSGSELQISDLIQLKSGLDTLITYLTSGRE